MNKKPNQVLVQDILKFDLTPFKKRLEEINERNKLYKKIKTVRDVEERDCLKDLITYHNDLLQIIKKNKLKPEELVHIAFAPKTKKLAKKADTLNLSKFGGVPFCFMRDLVPHLKDKEKAVAVLNELYPQDRSDKTYYRFIGDINSLSPTFYMNRIQTVLRDEESDYETHPLYRVESYRAPHFFTMFGSIFVKPYYENLASLTHNGVFESQQYNSLDKYTPAQIADYVAVFNLFKTQHLDGSDEGSVDNFELAEITEWEIYLEKEDEDMWDDENPPLPRPESNMKLFGYPDSQQTVPKLYATFGMFGPRELMPFLTIWGKDVDSTVQIYTDHLAMNSSQSECKYMKVDISST